MLKIIQEGLTFDDLLLVPSASSVLPKQVSLKTSLTKNISLNIPIVSAAMDTVTEAQMAISLAQEGGIGFIHKNMSIDEQTKAVLAVKKYESGIVTEPVVVNQDMSIFELRKLHKTYGFKGFPVLDKDQKLIGIITSRDVRFETADKKVKDLMTPKSKLITVTENLSEKNAQFLMHKHRIEKVLVIDKDWNLKGLITVKDFKKAAQKPNACKDQKGRLRVGAAVGVNMMDRVDALVKASCDLLLVDSSHGHAKAVIDEVKKIKNKYPNVDLIAGNVATKEAALALVDAGADAIKVGIGPGSICTTRIVTGSGMPQITAIDNVVSALKNSDVKIIADGGIRFSGDIAKAIGAGADCVMLGSMLAGAKESPGEIEIFQGRSFKTYRGMGSISAMEKGGSDRYFQDSKQKDKLVPEGIEGRVPYKGVLSDILHQQTGGLRASLGLTGSKDIKALQKNAKFVKITQAGTNESHVHDVTITKESPNYSR